MVLEKDLDKVITVDHAVHDDKMIIQFLTKKSFYANGTSRRMLSILIKLKGLENTVYFSPKHIRVGTDEVQYVTIESSVLYDPLQLINQPVEIK